MSFPSYPKYKDFGLAWLRAIPCHWRIGTLRRLIISASNGTTANQIEWVNDAIAVSRIETISTGEVNFDKVGFVENTAATTRFLLNEGDILLSHINSLAMVGNVALYKGEQPLVHGMNLLRLKPVRGLASSEWLIYWLKSKNIRQEFESRAKPAINQASISTGSVLSTPAVIPPIDEQTQIARFLDHETAKIDALIREQEHLIALLQEKRQAVISHAVTKGLDPDVPMKDSGVEWLGEVPAHWEVRKVSYDFTAVKGPRGAILTKEYCAANQGPYPVYSGQTDNAGVLGSIDDFDFSLGSNGGLLTTTVGAKAMSLNFVTKDISLSQNCMLIRPISKQIFIKFYFYHLQPLFRLERAMIPDHMQPSFRMDDLYKFFVAQPPLKEQEAIALALDVEMGRFDALEREARLLIERLKERRSALISAAVTGKIDVRNWQPPSDESALDGSVRETGMESTP